MSHANKNSVIDIYDYVGGNLCFNPMSTHISLLFWGGVFFCVFFVVAVVRFLSGIGCPK